MNLVLLALIAVVIGVARLLRLRGREEDRFGASVFSAGVEVISAFVVVSRLQDRPRNTKAKKE